MRRSEYSGHGWRTSMVQPAAAAPASRQASTRSLRAWRLATVAERTYHWATVWSGTMLGFSPAFRNTPWTRSVAAMCWRRAATAL